MVYTATYFDWPGKQRRTASYETGPESDRIRRPALGQGQGTCDANRQQARKLISFFFAFHPSRPFSLSLSCVIPAFPCHCCFVWQGVCEQTLSAYPLFYNPLFYLEYHPDSRHIFDWCRFLWLQVLSPFTASLVFDAALAHVLCLFYLMAFTPV
ncbi:hypothetical protein BDR07DRAFT_431968 [Suillus spraguei]|nr:hypothetical protein BDR07DRAFT_431968 [Suillus spraguei]